MYLVQVDKAMQEPQGGESPDQVGGHDSRGVGRQVEVGDEQE